VAWWENEDVLFEDLMTALEVELFEGLEFTP